jgi:hypothetical protein
MKKLMQIDENKLIGIIKSMLAEQTTVNPIRTTINSTLPNINTFDIPTQKVQGSVGMGDDDTDYLVQQQAAQQQAAQQQAAQQQRKTRACARYNEKTTGPYNLCDSGKAIKTLQTKLGFEGSAIDGKLGVLTMRAAQKKGLVQNNTILDNKINNFNSNVVTTNTKQSNSSSGYITINKRYLGLPGAIFQAYKKAEWINLTNPDGRTTVTTNCSNLKTNRYYKYFPTEQKGWVTPTTTKNLSGLLNYYFCQTKTNAINVTNEVITELSNERSKYFVGSTFTAIKKSHGGIHIKNEKGGVNLATTCGELNTNKFRRNYRIPNSQVGTTIELPKLSEKIKPLFCSTNK